MGLVKRDFLVNDRDLLVEHPRQMAIDVVQQIMLIDPTLPKRLELCRPAQIDIVGTELRRMYKLPTFSLVLEQSL